MSNTTTAPRIDADQIAFTDDRLHAWLLHDDAPGAVPVFWQRLDRPCDTCGGKGWETCAEGAERCEDCRESGRHTFDIKLEQSCRHCTRSATDLCEECWGFRTLESTRRVSVVPGLILPIVDWDYEGYTDDLIELWMDGTAHRVSATDDGHARETLDPFPSAAASGLWAVKLKVA